MGLAHHLLSIPLMERHSFTTLLQLSCVYVMLLINYSTIKQLSTATLKQVIKVEGEKSWAHE
jgi:hypothetical protein